jgi:type IV pilus assembly protein PilX
MNAQPGYCGRTSRQSGISLVVVMVVLMLSALLAAGTARTALLNEALTGNLGDEQRAMQVAETLLADAQQSLQLHLQQTASRPAADDLPNARGEAFLPQGRTAFARFSLALVNASGPATPCFRGYCVLPPDPDQPLGHWWSEQETLDAMWTYGASFGTYTGAVPAPGHGLLGRARFWVEVYPYSKTVDAPVVQPPDTHPFVYQITVVARGLKASTQVVLRSVVVPSPAL